MQNDYEINGDVTTLFINHKGEKVKILIDTEDLPKIKQYNSWVIRQKNKPYAFTYREKPRVNGKRRRENIYLHRAILDFPENLDVDHLNGDTLDNRKSNLRALTKSQHRQNCIGARSGNVTGVRGVNLRPDGKKYVASSSLDGKTIYLGCFDTIEEADCVAKEYRKKYMPFSYEGSN